jgi:CPA1 family monovalent cation:H+ antiporter
VTDPEHAQRENDRVTADIALGLVMLAVVLAVRMVGDRANLPSSALLTVVGLVYALLPGRNLGLDPHVVLYVLLPPLLYSTALSSSLVALRKNLRSVISLSVVLVFVTTFAVGGSFMAVVPGLPLAAGLAFGAAVAPPDPVAALSVGRRAGLPPRLLTLIEGEGLLNDATALTTYQIAVAAAVAGAGLSVPAAAGRFAVTAVGGVAIGVALAGLLRLLQPVLRDPLSANAVSLATPFAAYLAGEAAHVSGVLAVVITGLVVGYGRPRIATGAGRLQIAAVWRLVEFVLEGFVFLLIGQQLPTVVRGLDAYSTAVIVEAAVTAVGVVLFVRPLFLVLSNLTPWSLHARLGEQKQLRSRMLGGREIAALSWSGTRGVISLAIAFALPLSTHAGAPFPGRDLILFCTYLVVLVTLVGQGLTFAPLLRRLNIRANQADAIRLRNEARAAAVTSALDHLDDIAADEDVPEHVVADLREQLSAQQRRYRSRLDSLATANTANGETMRPPLYEAAVRARRAVIDAQREELVRWRDTDRLDDKALRILQTELDLQERSLPNLGLGR